MISQSSNVVVDCPICGRPLEMQSKFVGQEVCCAHCRGKLIASEADDGSLTTSNSSGKDSLHRAEQLIRATFNTGRSVSRRRRQMRLSRAANVDSQKRTDSFHCTMPQNCECEGNPQPTVLLVEHRDEVFARLATDIAGFGIRVVRAKSATEATHLYEKYKPVLLVGNVDLPEQSGWLMTAKLRLFDRRIRIWLYRRQPSDYGQEIANFLNVDSLLSYQGDLLRLSERIIDLMEKRSLSQAGKKGSGSGKKSTTA